MALSGVTIASIITGAFILVTFCCWIAWFHIRRRNIKLAKELWAHIEQPAQGTNDRTRWLHMPPLIETEDLEDRDCDAGDENNPEVVARRHRIRGYMMWVATPDKNYTGNERPPPAVYRDPRPTARALRGENLGNPGSSRFREEELVAPSAVDRVLRWMTSQIVNRPRHDVVDLELQRDGAEPQYRIPSAPRLVKLVPCHKCGQKYSGRKIEHVCSVFCTDCGDHFPMSWETIGNREEVEGEPTPYEKHLLGDKHMAVRLGFKYCDACDVTHQPIGHFEHLETKNHRKHVRAWEDEKGYRFPGDGGNEEYGAPRRSGSPIPERVPFFGDRFKEMLPSIMGGHGKQENSRDMETCISRKQAERDRNIQDFLSKPAPLNLPRGNMLLSLPQRPGDRRRSDLWDPQVLPRPGNLTTSHSHNRRPTMPDDSVLPIIEGPEGHDGHVRPISSSSNVISDYSDSAGDAYDNPPLAQSHVGDYSHLTSPSRVTESDSSPSCYTSRDGQQLHDDPMYGESSKYYGPHTPGRPLPITPSRRGPAPLPPPTRESRSQRIALYGQDIELQSMPPTVVAHRRRISFSYDEADMTEIDQHDEHQPLSPRKPERRRFSNHFTR